MKLSRQEKIDHIQELLSLELIRPSFIEVSKENGYDKYFQNLKSFDDMTDRQVSICYNRTCKMNMLATCKMLGVSFDFGITSDLFN